MSIIVDEDEASQSLEDQNKEIILLLKTQVHLLEIIASMEHGEAIETVGD